MTEPPVAPRLASGTARLLALLLGALVLVLGSHLYFRFTFPSDQTPEGAYLRIVRAVNEGKPEAMFAYTEEAAQHACFTIRDYRKNALDHARGKYPAPEFEKLRAQYEPYATAPDGAGVFARMVAEQGWMNQLRRDVSGVKKIEIDGPRATVETVRSTRYSMRRRPNGIWGLTAFTPTLVDEAERAAQDLDQVKKVAADFARVAEKKP